MREKKNPSQKPVFSIFSRRQQESLNANDFPDILLSYILNL